jgi:hypothetical protein
MSSCPNPAQVKDSNPPFANGHSYRNPQLSCHQVVTSFYPSANPYDLNGCPPMRVAVTSYAQRIYEYTGNVSS